MTPIKVSEGIAEYLKRELQEERVYAGYLPRIDMSAKKGIRSPSIAVRIDQIVDALESEGNLKIYVLTYDEDMEQGCISLYNQLERIRYLLLKDNPIDGKYHFNLRETELVTTIPDEQPYPYWLGSIEVVIRLASIREENKNGILSWS